MTDYTQGSMWGENDFDNSGAKRAREGIERVMAAEDRWHLESMRNAVPFLESHPEFSSDDMYRHKLWAWQPHHFNAIGAFCRKLRSAGYISKPVRFIYSARGPAHARRIPVCRSMIYRGPHA